MRIVDFKELLSLPSYTLFSVIDCNAARHSAIVKELYSKLPAMRGVLGFHGSKVNVLDGHEFSFDAMTEAYIKSEPLSTLSHQPWQTSEFRHDMHSATNFGIWEKSEIEELVTKLTRSLATLAVSPNIVSN
jgi:hypothetical protein